jgi:hypothetical protein
LFCIFFVGTVRRKKGKKGEWVPVRKTREVRGKAIPVEQNRSYNIASSKEKKRRRRDKTKLGDIDVRLPVGPVPAYLRAGWRVAEEEGRQRQLLVPSMAVWRYGRERESMYQQHQHWQ